MSNDLQTVEVQPTDEELSNFLKGKDNPFDVFVAAKTPEADFQAVHVPSLYPDVHKRIEAIIDRYRLDNVCRANEIPRSGVVVILGGRGTGKTHTVHAVRTIGLDVMPRVVVTPSIFEPHRPFYEYLLHQLVRHFQNEGGDGQTSTIKQLADALTRRVLVQALNAMTEVEWLSENFKGRLQYLLYLWGWGTKHVSEGKRQLVASLDGRKCSIIDACRMFELEPSTLKRAALNYVVREEKSPSIGGQIRRGLYAQLVECVFDDSDETLYEFLLDGYTQVEKKSQPSREILVDELLRALLELCLLGRMPVVFAFDALENLLDDPPDPKRCHAFFRGIADVIDSQRGIPFLIFAEKGHWQQAYHNGMTDYVKQRFQQGVLRVPGYGSVSGFSFPPITAERLNSVVAARLKPLREQFDERGPSNASPCYPFTHEDLDVIARTHEKENEPPPLRQALQRLGELYDRRLNGQVTETFASIPEPQTPQHDAPILELLESLWKQEERTAKRELSENSLSGLADRLHAGLLIWLEFLIEENVQINSGSVKAAENQVLTDHPTYGQVTKFRWESDSKQAEIGLGLLLGHRAGLPRDLQTKLKMAALKKRPFTKLIILWPKGTGLSPPIAKHFTGKTKEIWEEYSKDGVIKGVDFVSVDSDSFAPWLLLTTWLKDIRGDVPQATEDIVRHFVVEQTVDLQEFLIPEVL